MRHPSVQASHARASPPRRGAPSGTSPSWRTAAPGYTKRATTLPRPRSACLGGKQKARARLVMVSSFHAPSGVVSLNCEVNKEKERERESERASEYLSLAVDFSINLFPFVLSKSPAIQDGQTMDSPLGRPSHRSVFLGHVIRRSWNRKKGNPLNSNPILLSRLQYIDHIRSAAFLVQHASA